ncbi:MAG: hypothetical protein K1X79_04950 [Oligoflexia bacterium]|nr:hypothetical protein [Oligoflexia bacterium]
MSRALLIAKRDIQSFFLTPRGFVLLGAAMGLWGFYFLNILARYNALISRAAGMKLDPLVTVPTLQQFVIEPFFQLVVVSLALLIPLLAMRTLPEERMAGTFELLRTTPGSSWTLVFGKFLGLAFLLLLFCALALAYPLALALYGAPDCGTILSAALGLYLCGLSFCAVALACSATAERPLNAAVSSVMLLAVMLLLHTPSVVVPHSVGYWLEILSAYLELTSFASGFVSLQGLVYFISIVALGLALAVCRLEAEQSDKKALGNFSLNFLASTAAIGLVLICASAALYIIQAQASVLSSAQLAIGLGLLLISLSNKLHFGRAAIRLLFMVTFLTAGIYAATSSRLAWDWSLARKFTISEHLRALVQELKQPLVITYTRQGDLRIDKQIELMLGLVVKSAPELISLNLLQANQSAQSYLATLQYGDAKKVRLNELNFDSISGAIVSLLRERPQKVYFVSTSGAPRVDDTGPFGLSKLVTALQYEGLELLSLSDAATEVPLDADALVLVGPRAPLPDGMFGAITRYLNLGGRLLLAVDPLFVGYYQPLLRRLNLSCEDQVIIDRDQMNFSGGREGLQPLIRARSEHPIVNKLGLSRATIMNVVAPCKAGSAATSSYKSDNILWTSADSASDSRILELLNGQTSLSSAFIGKNNSDPIAVAVAVTTQAGAPIAVAVGDSDWVLNSAFDYYSNRDLALNCLQWLLGNDWALVARARNEVNSAAALSSAEFQRFGTAAVLMAEALMLLGFTLWAWRSRRT